jgi:hypothetical protein
LKMTSSPRGGYSLTCLGGSNTKTSIQLPSTMSSERFLWISMRIRRMSSIMMTLLSSYLKTLTEARSALLSTITRDTFWTLRVLVTLKTGLLKVSMHCNCIKYLRGSLALISTITRWIWKLNLILLLKSNPILWQGFLILLWIWTRKQSRTKNFMKKKCQKMYIIELITLSSNFRNRLCYEFKPVDPIQ